MADGFKNRKELILDAARAGIERLARSAKGEKALGKSCRVTIEETPQVIIVRCKDGELFRLEYTS
jgi:hypothetical protein